MLVLRTYPSDSLFAADFSETIPIFEQDACVLKAEDTNLRDLPTRELPAEMSTVLGSEQIYLHGETLVLPSKDSPVLPTEEGFDQVRGFDRSTYRLCSTGDGYAMSSPSRYVRLGEQILGPISEAELRDLALRGGVTARTPVSSDHANWTTAADVPGIVFAPTSASRVATPSVPASVSCPDQNNLRLVVRFPDGRIASYPLAIGQYETGNAGSCGISDPRRGSGHPSCRVTG